MFQYICDISTFSDLTLKVHDIGLTLCTIQPCFIILNS